MSTKTELDLGPIEGRRQAALVTGEAVIAVGIGNTAALQTVANAIARSAADVPDLIAEIKRLREESA